MTFPKDITIRIPLGNNNGLSSSISPSIIKSASTRFDNSFGEEGILLFPNKPGRLFGNKSTYNYNSGTSNTGGYIPPFNFKNGKAQIQPIRNFNEVNLPKNPKPSSDLAKIQLDLKDNGDGTFSREGFNGTYTVRSDGGIEFSGGFHINNGRPVQCPPQVYFPGQGWFFLGNKSNSSNTTDTFTPATITPLPAVTPQQPLPAAAPPGPLPQPATPVSAGFKPATTTVNRQKLTQELNKIKEKLTEEIIRQNNLIKLPNFNSLDEMSIGPLNLLIKDLQQLQGHYNKDSEMVTLLASLINELKSLIKEKKAEAQALSSSSPATPRPAPTPPPPPAPPVQAGLKPALTYTIPEEIKTNLETAFKALEKEYKDDEKTMGLIKEAKKHLDTSLENDIKDRNLEKSIDALATIISEYQRLESSDETITPDIKRLDDFLGDLLALNPNKKLDEADEKQLESSLQQFKGRCNDNNTNDFNSKRENYKTLDNFRDIATSLVETKSIRDLKKDINKISEGVQDPTITNQAKVIDSLLEKLIQKRERSILEHGIWIEISNSTTPNSSLHEKLYSLHENIFYEKISNSERTTFPKIFPKLFSFNAQTGDIKKKSPDELETLISELKKLQGHFSHKELVTFIARLMAELGQLKAQPPAAKPAPPPAK